MLPKMTFYLLVAITYCNITVCQECNHDTLFINYLSGRWEAYRFIPGDISNIDNEEASTYLGKTLIFKKNEVWIWEKKRENPSFNFYKVNFAYDLDDNWRMNYNKININQDSVIVCEIKYSKFQDYKDRSFFYILSNGEIIFVEQGMFFFLRKE
jgi:hypothetical protein